MIVAFIGGGVLPLIVSAIFGRKKSRSDLNIDRDGEILKWLDKALHVADELIETKYHLHEATVKLERCEEAKKDCDCHEREQEAHQPL